MNYDNVIIIKYIYIYIYIVQHCNKVKKEKTKSKILRATLKIPYPPPPQTESELVQFYDIVNADGRTYILYVVSHVFLCTWPRKSPTALSFFFFFICRFFSYDKGHIHQGDAPGHQILHDVRRIDHSPRLLGDGRMDSSEQTHLHNKTRGECVTRTPVHVVMETRREAINCGAQWQRPAIAGERVARSPTGTRRIRH